METETKFVRLETVFRLFWGHGTRYEISQAQALRAFMMRYQPLPHRAWSNQVCRKAILQQHPWLDWWIASPLLRAAITLSWEQKNKLFRPVTWKLYSDCTMHMVPVRCFSEAELALMQKRMAALPLTREEAYGELVALDSRR